MGEGTMNDTEIEEMTADEWADMQESYQQYRFHCGYEGDFETWLAEPDPEEDPEYIAYCEEQEPRGELAYCPETLACHTCHLDAGNKPDITEETVVRRKVVKLGRVVGTDPTQTYELECGHMAF